MNIKIYKWLLIMIGCSALGIFLSGCSGLRVIDRTNNSVIDEGMTQSVGELSDELDGYTEQEEIFEMTVLEEQLFDGLKQMVSEKLKNLVHQEAHYDDIDLSLYRLEETADYVFASMWFDQEQMPHLFIGFVLMGQNGQFNVSKLYVGTVFVNMPKTTLFAKPGYLALISQRPFSTYEECYLFNTADQIELESALWSDRTVTYYKNLERFMLEGDFESAMALEDVSEYPMTYEREMFHSGQVIFNESIRLAESVNLNQMSEVYKAYQWGLDYYFMQHYALTTEELIEEDFQSMLSEKSEDFGAKYVLEIKQIKHGLLLYADLMAKLGNDKAAESLRQKVEKLL